jgi:hypothetical protein
MPSAGFEPAVPASDESQALTLDGLTTDSVDDVSYPYKIRSKIIVLWVMLFTVLNTRRESFLN